MKKSLIILSSLLSIGALSGCNFDDFHEHTFKSEFTYDETNHWHEASCEHTNLISGLEAHNFVDDNICDDCGYVKPTEEQPHEHTFSSKWSNDETNHWHASTCEHNELTSDLEAHIYGDDNICDECGYEKPVEEKPHEHTFKTNYSYDETNHWYEATCGHHELTSSLEAHNFGDDDICDDCGYIKPAPAHEHSYSQEWSKDQVNHWHASTCEHTGFNKDFGAHTFVNGVCSACGYVEPVSPKPIYTFNFIGFNCTLNNEVTYEEGSEVNLTFSVDEGYHLDEIITVLGTDSYEFDIEEKTLSLEVNNNITVVTHAFKDEEEEEINTDAYYRLVPDTANYKTEGKEGQYVIASHALVIGNQCWQTYLVYDGVGEECEEKGIEVWKNKADAEAKNKADYKCEYKNYTLSGSDRFDEYYLTGVSFVNLVDDLYARAYFIKDGVKTYSEIDEWSMLKSCHDYYNVGQMMKYGEGIEIPSYLYHGHEIVRATVEYASQLQTLFDYKADHLAKDEIYKYGIAHTDKYDGTRLIFTTTQQIYDFFHDESNDFGDMVLVFDMPCYVDSIRTPYVWSHTIRIDSTTPEVTIGSIYSPQTHKSIEIDNITVGDVHAINCMLVARNCQIGTADAMDDQVEIFDSTINKLDVNSSAVCNLHSCTFVSKEKGDYIDISDCGNVTFDNCKFENADFRVTDDWSSYNDKDTTLTFKGTSTNIKSSKFLFSLKRSGSTATIIDEIYAENSTFSSDETKFLLVIDGLYNQCGFNLVVLSGGHYTKDPSRDGIVQIKNNCEIIPSQFTNQGVTYSYEIVEKENSPKSYIDSLTKYRDDQLEIISTCDALDAKIFSVRSSGLLDLAKIDLFGNNYTKEEMDDVYQFHYSRMTDMFKDDARYDLSGALLNLLNSYKEQIVGYDMEIGWLDQIYNAYVEFLRNSPTLFTIIETYNSGVQQLNGEFAYIMEHISI